MTMDQYPLGVSPYILGTGDRFTTGDLTLEFKNNLDGLIAEVDDPDSVARELAAENLFGFLALKRFDHAESITLFVNNAKRYG